jgi:hypothetical protein
MRQDIIPIAGLTVISPCSSIAAFQEYGNPNVLPNKNHVAFYNE